jgi:hypothetical protein
MRFFIQNLKTRIFLYSSIILTEDQYEPDLETYIQEKIFWEKSSKEYVTMSDGAELLCSYTTQNKSSSGITILFGPGYGTGVPSWTDLWDELSPDFDFFVFDSREKSTSRVKWGHKANMERLGLDIKEIVEHFKFDESKLIIISASFGCSTLARAIVETDLNPAGIVFIGPSIKFILPRKILWLAYLIPSFILQYIAFPIVKLWINLVIPKGFQRKNYHGFISRANAMRWKKTLSIAKWNAMVDYEKITVPALITKDSKDALHTVSFSDNISAAIEGSRILEVPSYNYMHHRPGVKEFAQSLKDFIEEILPI